MSAYHHLRIEEEFKESILSKSSTLSERLVVVAGAAPATLKYYLDWQIFIDIRISLYYINV